MTVSGYFTTRLTPTLCLLGRQFRYHQHTLPDPSPPRPAFCDLLSIQSADQSHAMSFRSNNAILAVSFLVLLLLPALSAHPVAEFGGPAVSIPECVSAGERLKDTWWDIWYSIIDSIADS
jgi:hypothetical protein